MSWQKLTHYDTNAVQVTKEKKMNYVIKPLKKTHYQGQGTELPFEIPAPCLVPGMQSCVQFQSSPR